MLNGMLVGCMLNYKWQKIVPVVGTKGNTTDSEILWFILWAP